MEVEALVEGSALSRLGTMPPPASKQPITTASKPTSASSDADSNSGSLASYHKDPQWPDVLAAYASRERRNTRYAGQSVGGTVVVHYIKRNEWFLEAALALLGDDGNIEEGEIGLR
jgi:hypothetical protein